MINKKYLILSFIVSVLLYQISCDVKGVEYYQPEVLATHFNGEHFVGSVTCAECHKDIYDSHILSAHYNTSAIVDSDNIQGSFKEGENKISLGSAEVKMFKKGNEFFQQAQTKDSEIANKAQKIDIVIGSGIKGQSHLTWEEDALFQLQSSYYPPADKWINSPGFPEQLIKRPIRDGCLKCHVTFATNKDFSGQGNRYDKDKMVFGVDCEKCHRPAEQHVVYHRENPEVKTAMHIMKIDTLSRQLRLDVCAQCHSGPRDGIIRGNSFTFLPGDRLDEYSRNFFTGTQNKDLDVHGNQFGLLTSSECFKQSPEMDCGTCHDSHQKQRGDTSFFNNKCKSCHDSAKTLVCGEGSEALAAVDNNCISCHMPTVASKAMAVQLGAERETGVQIRTHLIAVYPTETNSHESQIDSSSIQEIKGFLGEQD